MYTTKIILLVYRIAIYLYFDKKYRIRSTNA